MVPSDLRIIKLMVHTICNISNNAWYRFRVNNPYEIFIIKLETFDQDLRELCHLLEVDNKELGIPDQRPFSNSLWSIAFKLVRTSGNHG